MTDRIDISAEIESICAKLGVEYNAVTLLTVTPAAAEVIVLRRNETGSFHINQATGAVVSDRFEFKVMT